MKHLLLGVHFGNFKLSFGRRLRQRMILKCVLRVLRVQHDYFLLFYQSDHCYLALSLFLTSSLLSPCYRLVMDPTDRALHQQHRGQGLSPVQPFLARLSSAKKKCEDRTMKIPVGNQLRNNIEAHGRRCWADILLLYLIIGN